MPTEFTPWLSLSGGILVGVSALLIMARGGRITGISGLTTRIFAGEIDARSQRVAVVFIFGLVLSAPLWVWLSGSLPDQQVPGNFAVMAVSGLLVGFAAALSGGCTSGQSVCGVSHGAVRSIMATGTFMAACISAVFVPRHIFGA